MALTASDPSSISLAILGAGSWGTALGWLLGSKGYRISLWARSEELAERMKVSRENYVYLPGAVLPESVSITHSISEALQEAAFVVTAPPCVGVRSIIEEACPFLRKDAIILSATKGLASGTDLQGEGTARRPSEIILECWGEGMRERVAVLSGPNLAREIVRGIPSTTVVACGNLQTAETFQDLFTTRSFRVYTNQDTAGVELAGALKNIIAIGAGVSDGLGFGDNTKAALVTRGLVEITRLGVALGGRPETFTGLAGMGDLFATCASNHSRNRRLGFRLAQGETLEQITASTRMIAEGISTTEAAMRFATDHQIDIPISREIHAMLFEGKSPHQAVTDLMARTTKSELVDVPWFPGETR